jgi:hypothetical protein
MRSDIIHQVPLRRVEGGRWSIFTRAVASRATKMRQNKENASKQKRELSSDFIGTEKALV